MMKKFFEHNNAICETDKVGEGTRIWAFSHILPGAVIGKNCNICDHVFIENDVIIGNNVTIKSGVQLWDGIKIEDNVFIGPNATFSNDIFPRSKQHPSEFTKTIICHGASIGANATILPGVKIGRDAMVGAGAVVTKDIPSKAVVVGNPARIIRYVTTTNAKDSNYFPIPENFSPKTKINVGECELWSMPVFSDMRGDLLVTEFSKNLPFIPRRVFFVSGVDNDNVRGEHAHKECHQFLIALKGSLNVVVDDGKNSKEIRLDNQKIGLYMPPEIWGIQYKFSKDAILCVFASHEYNDQEYIREYSDFERTIGNVK
jgi:UDP-2-acetamido-3-amino-2,3-dideoxy-glucuronate N-acetyltransferase